MSLKKRPGSPFWWTDFYHAGHRVRESTGEVDRAAAQKRHNEIQVALWSAVPDTTDATWGKAVDLWLDTAERSSSELQSLAKFAKGYDDRRLSEVTAASLEVALAFCKTPGTYMRYRAMLMAILNMAKKKGWIAALPPVATRRDKKRKARDWITQEQWLVLQAELPKHMRPMATFAIETGLRQDNVLKLRWQQVDLTAKRAWFEASEMKTDAALAVPLNDAAVAVLAAQQGQHDTWVFPYRGKPVSEIKTAWISACVRADVGKIVDGRYEGFTWHGLRHTWATWHAQNGTPLDVLQKLGGWSDLRMVMNYAHHSPTHLASFAGNNRRPV